MEDFSKMSNKELANLIKPSSGGISSDEMRVKQQFLDQVKEFGLTPCFRHQDKLIFAVFSNSSGGT